LSQGTRSLEPAHTSRMRSATCHLACYCCLLPAVPLVMAPMRDQSPENAASVSASNTCGQIQQHWLIVYPDREQEVPPQCSSCMRCRIGEHMPAYIHSSSQGHPGKTPAACCEALAACCAAVAVSHGTVGMPVPASDRGLPCPAAQPHSPAAEMFLFYSPAGKQLPCPHILECRQPYGQDRGNITLVTICTLTQVSKASLT
jgi:hypothetical protein